MKARVLRKGLQLVGGLGAMAILLATLRGALHETAVSGLRLETGRLGASLALVVSSYLVAARVWAMVLSRLGFRVRYGEALQLWSFSNLGRYLPGKIWQVVGAAVVARDLGLPAGLVATAAALTVAFLIGTATLLGMLLLPGAFPGRDVPGLLPGVALFGFLLPLFQPGLLHALLRRLPEGLGLRGIAPLSRGTVLLFLLAHMLLWVWMGGAFFVFASSFGELAPARFPQCVGAHALATVAGLVAFFAPGGLGVREGMIGLLLREAGGGELPVHAVAVGFRGLTIAGELVVFVAALAARVAGKRRRRGREERPAAGGGPRGGPRS